MWVAFSLDFCRLLETALISRAHSNDCMYERKHKTLHILKKNDFNSRLLWPNAKAHTNGSLIKNSLRLFHFIFLLHGVWIELVGLDHKYNSRLHLFVYTYVETEKVKIIITYKLKLGLHNMPYSIVTNWPKLFVHKLTNPKGKYLAP